MDFIYALWKYILTSAPYLLIGFVAGGAINQFVTIKKVKKWLGADKLSSVLKAAIVGVPLPLCSCSVIPTAISLRKSGASKASTSAFLIATPESGVDSISMTYALMDLPMTIIRPIAAFTSAFVAGALQIVFNPEEKASFEVAEDASAIFENDDGTKTIITAPKGFLERVKESIRYGFGDLVNDIALWLAIGMVAGALIDFLVPPAFFENLSPAISRLAILAIGIPLYICASASTPIAVSLILKGMSPGVALILLLVGPATNISNIAVLQKYIGMKGVVINVIAIVIVALGFSYLTDFLYANYFTQNFSFSVVHEHIQDSIIFNLLAIFLTGLILKGIVIEEILPRLKKKEDKGCCH